MFSFSKWLESVITSFIVAEPASALPASKESADRLTGAAKKNRDNKRHGAGSKSKKDDGEKPVESKKREFDRRSGTGK